MTPTLLLFALSSVSASLLPDTTVPADTAAYWQFAEGEADYFDLDAVVVTGQGAEVKRRRLSTRVATVGAATLDRVASVRLDQALQAAVPNMKISLSGGQPGATSNLLSRGLSSAFSNNTPVVYVDGVRVDNSNTALMLNNDLNGGNHAMAGQTSANSALADLPIDNIERIEYVTGGAATTLYGSDAANGVIQIFTKTGGKGRFNASLSAEVGAEVATSDFYFSSRTADMLHQKALMQRYRLTADGGSERGGWSLGASMMHTPGTVVGNAQEQKRYDLRFGAHYKINNRLEYVTSWGLAFQQLRYARNGNEGLYSGLWSLECGDLGYADNTLGLKTSYPLRYRDAAGNWQRYFQTTNIDELTPAELSVLQRLCAQGEGLSDHTERVRRTQTSQQLIYRPMTGLTVKAILGLDMRNTFNRYSVSDAWLEATGMRSVMPKSSMRTMERDYLGLTADLNVQYHWHNDWMSAVTTAGFQFFSTDDHQSSAFGQDLRDGSLSINGAATRTADEWLSYLYNYGWFVQENLGWNDRYHLDLGLRADCNSAFGENVGWQYYPKVGLSYLMSQESWLQHSWWLSQLRLFANYGVAGLYPPAFAYQRTVAFDSYQGQLAATFGQYGNPDLGPEKKHSTEFGLDLGLWKGMVNLAATYYYSLTRDALFAVPLQPSVGQGSSLANVGRIVNRGWEVVLGLNLTPTRHTRINVNASLNTNHNLVESIGGAAPFAIGGFSSSIQSIVAEGQSVGFLRASRSTLNADGTVTTEKLQNLGNTLPKMYGALSLDVQWRGLEVFANADWQTGAYVHSYNAQFRFRNGIRCDEVPEAMLQAWGMAADGSNRWLVQKTHWNDATNFFVYRSDYLKVRNIGVNYTFDRPCRGLRAVQVGFHVNNPFTITACPVDPEATISTTLTQGAVATGGFNYATYSAPRQYVGSVTVRF